MGAKGISSVPQAESGSSVDWTVRLPARQSGCFWSLTASSAFSQIENQHYRPALTLIENLLRELKRLDDKMILTEVHLLESRVNHATKNYSKAKVCRYPHHVEA